MRLILVRHVESWWNSEGRMQGGKSDSEPSDRGLRQAQRIAQALSSERMDAIYSSPLKRAYITAEIIAAPHHVQVKVEPEFREIEAGELEGATFEYMMEHYPSFWEEWTKGNPEVCFPGGGESLTQLRGRVWRAFTPILSEHLQGEVAIVAHFYSVLAIVLSALKLPLSTIKQLGQDRGAIDTLELEGDVARLVCLNDTCHLKGI